jgi:hypothetical protein
MPIITGTADGERQREQDGEGLDHVLEEQDQHRQHQQQAHQHGVDKTLLHLGLHLGVAAFCKTHGSRNIGPIDYLAEAGGGCVECDALGQIRTDRDDAVAVVALDRAYAFRIVDIGDARERNCAAAGGLDLQRPDGREIATHVDCGLDPDRDLPIVERDLGKGGIDIADGGDADRLGDLLRRDSEAGGLIHARMNLQFRTGQRAVGADIGKQRIGAELGFQNADGVVQVLVVLGEEVEGEVAFAAVIELQDTDIGNVAQLGEDFLFNIPLRAFTAVDFHFRQHWADDRYVAEHVVDHLLDERLIELVKRERDGRTAQFEIALRRRAAEDEDAFDAVDVLDPVIDRIRRLLGIVEPCIGRQLDGENDA